MVPTYPGFPTSYRNPVNVGVVNSWLATNPIYLWIAMTGFLPGGFSPSNLAQKSPVTSLHCTIVDLAHLERAHCFRLP